MKTLNDKDVLLTPTGEICKLLGKCQAPDG
jgi:hypothetical protein